MFELPEQWQDHFPTNHHQAVGFVPYTRGYALQMHVLCVCTTRVEGAWTAYCHHVPGMSPRDEEQQVLDHGDKLPEAVALAMFPELEGVPYDR